MFVEEPGDWPGPVGGVRDHGVGDVGMRIVDGAEGDSWIGAFQHHGVGRLVQPEAEAVALGLSDAARAHHLRHPIRRDDLTRKHGLPEAADIGNGRIDPTVSSASHREMENVLLQAPSTSR